MGVQLPKMQLGMAKTEARISQNYENVWDLGREWEMKKDSHGKREISGKSFLREREKSPFFGGLKLFWYLGNDCVY